jgi:TetR/AcrR family transcriptional regulator
MARATFSRIPPEKQEFILDVAAREFAEFGFHKANINTIATKAGISIGAMYKYFSSKEDLFCESLEMGIRFIRDTYERAEHASADPFEKIRTMFIKVLDIARERPHSLQVYMALLGSNMDEFAQRYARAIEEVGHSYLKHILVTGIREGYIDKDIDIDTAIFFLDNHLMMFSFTQISLYLKIREETFLEGPVNQMHIIDETIRVCKRMFEARPAAIKSGDPKS